MKKKRGQAQARVPGDEEKFLSALADDPKNGSLRLTYSDWLEERSRPLEALRQRTLAGVSETHYKLRRKSDGLFSPGSKRSSATQEVRAGLWSAEGMSWPELAHLKSHFTGVLRRGQRREDDRYLGVPVDDLEIVVFEVHVRIVTTLQFSLQVQQDPNISWRGKATMTIEDPEAGTKPSPRE